MVPYLEGHDYGLGVDTASGDIRNLAVTGERSEIPETGQIIFFDMKQVSTVSELHDVLGISASASGGIGPFQASARLSFANDRHVNDSSIFLVVTVRVVNAFSQIKAPGITDHAAALLANGQMQEFQSEFGDMFVRGLRTGGQVFGVIEVVTHDLSDKTAVSASLSGSFGAFSADGQFDHTFQETLKNRKQTVNCYIEGGQVDAVPTQVDTMINFATNWPKTVEQHAVPYEAQLDPYSVLPLPAQPNFIDLQHQKDVLIECSILRDQDLQALNNVDYILAHPEQFVNVENFNLSQLRDELSADLNTIAAAASTAVDHPKEAKIPELTLKGPISLPERVKQPIAGLPDFSKVAGSPVGDLTPFKSQAQAAVEAIKALGFQVDVEPDPHVHLSDHDARQIDRFPEEPLFDLVVSGQSPAPGSVIPMGSTVTLLLVPFK